MPMDQRMVSYDGSIIAGDQRTKQKEQCPGIYLETDEIGNGEGNERMPRPGRAQAS